MCTNTDTVTLSHSLSPSLLFFYSHSLFLASCQWNRTMEETGKTPSVALSPGQPSAKKAKQGQNLPEMCGTKHIHRKPKLQSGDPRFALKTRVKSYHPAKKWFSSHHRGRGQETSHPSPLSLSVLKYLCGSETCLLGDEGDPADAVTDGCRKWGREGAWLVWWHLWASLDSVTRCQPVCDSTFCSRRVDYSRPYDV